MRRLVYTLCGADSDQRFSPHAWKVLMALAHKGLDFVERPTPFTEIPDIEGGFSPTVPVLDDGGKLVRDSFDIALYLEETYPDRPSLFNGEGGKALTRLVEGYVQTMQAAMMKIIVKDIHDCLAPVDQAHFRTTREKRLGMTLEDVEAGHKAEMQSFQFRLAPLRHMLKFQPFLGGENPLFADYILFGALQWARVVSSKRLLVDEDPIQEWFERCLQLHDGMGNKVRIAA